MLLIRQLAVGVLTCVSSPYLSLLSFVQVKAKGTLMQMVAADWLKSDKCEDDLGGRPGSIVQVFI